MSAGKLGNLLSQQVRTESVDCTMAICMYYVSLHLHTKGTKGHSMGSVVIQMQDCAYLYKSPPLKIFHWIPAWAADGMVPLDTWSMPEERLQAPSISRSDEFFLKQNLEFVWGAQDIDLTELNDLFIKVIP